MFTMLARKVANGIRLSWNMALLVLVSHQDFKKVFFTLKNNLSLTMLLLLLTYIQIDQIFLDEQTHL